MESVGNPGVVLPFPKNNIFYKVLGRWLILGITPVGSQLHLRGDCGCTIAHYLARSGHKFVDSRVLGLVNSNNLTVGDEMLAYDKECKGEL